MKTCAEISGSGIIVLRKIALIPRVVCAIASLGALLDVFSCSFCLDYNCKNGYEADD